MNSMPRRRLIATAMSTLLPILMGLAIAITGMTHDEPKAGWNGSALEVKEFYAAFEDMPKNTPTFTDAKDDFPNCDASTKNLRPKLVMHLDRHITIESFDSALDMTKDRNAWVLGSC